MREYKKGSVRGGSPNKMKECDYNMLVCIHTSKSIQKNFFMKQLPDSYHVPSL